MFYFQAIAKAESLDSANHTEEGEGGGGVVVNIIAGDREKYQN
jgi:hypothetical protein